MALRVHHTASISCMILTTLRSVSIFMPILQVRKNVRARGQVTYPRSHSELGLQPDLHAFEVKWSKRLRLRSHPVSPPHPHACSLCCLIPSGVCKWWAVGPPHSPCGHQRPCREQVGTSQAQAVNVDLLVFMLLTHEVLLNLGMQWPVGRQAV